MERRTLARCDQVGCGPRACGLRQLDHAADAQRRRNPLDRCGRLRARAFAEVASGYRDPESAGAARDERGDGLGRPIGADRIVGIGALHRIVRQHEVRNGARERADMIEACDERECTRARQPTIGRLEPEYAAERGRHADRAIGVRAERKRHQPSRDRPAGAAGGAAGHAAHVVRVARGTVVDVFACEVVGVFAHVECTDQDGAGRVEPLDQGCVARSRLALAVDLRARERRQTRNIEQVLDRVGNTGQRTKRMATRVISVNCPRPGASAVGGDGSKRIEGWIAERDRRERCFGHGRGADLATGDRMCDLGSRRGGGVGHHGVRPRKSEPAPPHPANLTRRRVRRGEKSRQGWP